MMASDAVIPTDRNDPIADDAIAKRISRLRATISSKKDIASSRFEHIRALDVRHQPEAPLRQLLNDWRQRAHQQQETS